MGSNPTGLAFQLRGCVLADKGIEEVFWAENIADRIVKREKFRFTGERVPSLKKWVVKSSSSLSGVIHIGNLSDVVRSEAVFRALGERGFPVEFIYVMEDMDPLRKVPNGVPDSFSEHIGRPVRDVPDPFGCHDSYAEHFSSNFFDVLPRFLDSDPEIFSMLGEYRKGSFNESIKLLMSRIPGLREILNRYRSEPLADDWVPWKPICEKCGKLQTTRVTGFDGVSVDYVCEDYSFESTVAKGCGHEGKSSLLSESGKMPWKSEWAVQWKHWGVCSEGAGKEYESSNSSFWTNTEIVEKILGFPAPEPIFYEYLMIDSKKISASKGNVIYPSEWLEVARPETLRLIFLKKLMKSRSFSWGSVPNLELEVDRLVENPNKLLCFVEMDSKRVLFPQKLDYSTAMFLGQLFENNRDALGMLVHMGALTGKESEQEKAGLEERLCLAREFAKRHLPEQERISFAPLEKVPVGFIGSGARALFPKTADLVEGAGSAEELQSNVFLLAKESNVSQGELFSSLYKAILGKPRGPKFGTLAFAFGLKKVAERLREIK